MNHNKLEIQKGLNDRELLHCKIIRDADKTDNFRVKDEEKVTTLLYLWNQDEIENGVITDKTFEDFMNEKIIKNSDRVTPIDYWISHLAFLFDFNYIAGLKYIMEKDYINKNIDKINYKNPETKEKMQKIKKYALDFVEKRISQEKA